MIGVPLLGSALTHAGVSPLCVCCCPNEVVKRRGGQPPSEKVKSRVEHNPQNDAIIARKSDGKVSRRRAIPTNPGHLKLFPGGNRPNASNLLESRDSQLETDLVLAGHQGAVSNDVEIQEFIQLMIMMDDGE